MPQFDTSFYCSQFFWLIICLCILIFSFKNFFVPRMNRLFNTRNDYIQKNIDEKNGIDSQIKNIEDSIKKNLEEAIQNSSQIIKAAKKEADIAFEKKREAIQIENDKLIGSAISKISDEKKLLKSNIESETDRISDLICQAILK